MHLTSMDLMFVHQHKQKIIYPCACTLHQWKRVMRYNSAACETQQATSIVLSTPKLLNASTEQIYIASQFKILSINIYSWKLETQ